MSDKEEIVQWLRNVSTGEVDLEGHGMCYSLLRMTDSLWDGYTPIMEYINSSMGRYAEENGTSPSFPVSHPEFEPSQAYFEHRLSGKSMNDKSQYGLNRRKLAEWLASELENSNVN